MKNKNLRNYALTWLVALIVFNIIVFAIPNEIMGIKRFELTSFWVSYALISLTFIGQLLTTIYVIKTAITKEKQFYKIPIIRMSLICLISAILLGLIFMTVTKIPSWIGIIVCAIALLIYVIYCVCAFTASEKVEEINNNTKAKIKTLKNLTAEAEILCSYAQSEIAKTETKNIHELFRFGDYVSNENLQDLEDKIKNIFDSFSNAIKTDNEEEIKKYSKDLFLLMKEKETKQKLFK